MALLLTSRLCRSPVIKSSFVKQLPSRSLIRNYTNDAKDAMARAARRKATLKEQAMAPAGPTGATNVIFCILFVNLLYFQLLTLEGVQWLVVPSWALVHFVIMEFLLVMVQVLSTKLSMLYMLGFRIITMYIYCFSMWPQYVKDRIKSTYFYFGSSIAVTAASAVAAFRSPVVMNLVTKNGFVVSKCLIPFIFLTDIFVLFQGIAVSLAAIIGTGMLAQGIEYREGETNEKQMNISNI